MTDPKWPATEIVQRKVAELIPYARNSRQHSTSQVKKIAASIREFGWTNPVLIDEANGIIAGHGRIMAADMLGIEVVPCMVAKGWTKAQRQAYVIADNKLATDATWDPEMLKVELTELHSLDFDLSLTGFDDKELKGLLDLGGALGDGDGEDIPEIRKKAVSEKGDVWILGRHRLVVGDCFEYVDAATGGEQVHLVATDPPYAIYGSSTGVASDIADDAMVVPFFEKILRMAFNQLPWFGHCYMFCDWRSWAAIQQAVKQSGMATKNMLVWDKGGQGMGNNYANCHELVGFFAKLPKQTAMGERRAGQRAVLRPNLIHCNRVPPKEKEHNAAKPVAVMEELINNSSGPGDLVLDPFGGSGSTLVACEKMDRRCAVTEHNPNYADVVIRRWQKFASAEAVLEIEQDVAKLGKRPVVCTFAQAEQGKRPEAPKAKTPAKTRKSKTK